MSSISAQSDLLTKHFPDLTPNQVLQMHQLADLFTEWNQKINLISRKDIENLWERHILHSLAIAKFIQFAPGSHIIDVGTGGGFPGIPLAILFPEVQFYLVDSIAKKIKVVQDIIASLGIPNAKALCERAENIDMQFDFAIGRAVTQIPQVFEWVGHKIKSKQINALPNGIIYLKGGDLKEELKPFGKRAEIYTLSDMYPQEFFQTKVIVYLDCGI